MKAEFRKLQSPTLICDLVAETTVHPVHLKLCTTPVWCLISFIASKNTFCAALTVFFLFFLVQSKVVLMILIDSEVCGLFRVTGTLFWKDTLID